MVAIGIQNHLEMIELSFNDLLSPGILDAYPQLVHGFFKMQR